MRSARDDENPNTQPFIDQRRPNTTPLPFRPDRDRRKRNGLDDAGARSDWKGAENDVADDVSIHDSDKGRHNEITLPQSIA